MLQVTPRLSPHVGGVETHVRQVASRLAQHGIETAILTADDTRRLPRHDELDGVAVLRAPAWRRGRDYLLAPGIASEIRGGGADCQGVVALTGRLEAWQREPGTSCTSSPSTRLSRRWRWRPPHGRACRTS